MHLGLLTKAGIVFGLMVLVIALKVVARRTRRPRMRRRR